MKNHYLLLFLLLLFSFAQVNAQTPYAHYPLDGNASDVSGNNLDGAIVGTPVATTNRYSQAGSAMDFSGASEYINLPEDFDFPTKTVIAWFNVSSVPSGNGDPIYVSDHASLQNGATYIYIYKVNGPNEVHIGAGSNYYDTAIDLNTWYQAAIVRSPTFTKVYLNGQVIAEWTNSSTFSSSNGVNYARVGSDRTNSTYTNGAIDDLLIYNAALSDTEILFNYQAWRDSIVEISGKVFFDANQNGVFDSLEQPVRNQLVNIGSDYIAVTNSSGNYVANPLPGNYTITTNPSGNLATFPLTPDSLVVNADSLGRTYGGNNFGIQVPPNYCEGNLSIIAFTPPPRPGFNNNVNVRYVNAFSANPVSQNIQFRYPPQQSYVSATPAPTTVDTLNRLLVWNVTNQNSGTLWQAMVTLYSPPSIAIGSILNMTALVTNSTCAQLDVPEMDHEVIVVGSFDPNDKAVSPVGADPGGRIPSSAQLSYTIRFQNTGTYLAENVNIVDTISGFLNISTLQVEAASHSYEVLVNGRVVTFRFAQINLPDSNTNEPLSHGFIKYSIQPSSSFVQGSVVENFADIYFDFNEPIRTNTTQNRADNFVGISKTENDNLGFVIYPNPLSIGSWQLVTDDEMIGKEIRIFDLTGRNVYSSHITNRQSEIDASQFAQGVYLLKIESSALRIVKL